MATEHSSDLPLNWPTDITYLRQPVHSTNLTPEQTKHLLHPVHSTHEEGRERPLPVVIIPLPLDPPTHISILPINNPSHPAYGQYGLFATRGLLPDTLVVPYLGLVHSNADHDTDHTSDYDISLDREAGISIDANTMGNEARMTNDYRGVPSYTDNSKFLSPIAKKKKKSQKGGDKVKPNAEFRDLWYLREEDGSIELGIGIFVLGPGKSGLRSDGIAAGQEILVNYGKGFWKGRGDKW